MTELGQWSTSCSLSLSLLHLLTLAAILLTLKTKTRWLMNQVYQCKYTTSAFGDNKTARTLKNNNNNKKKNDVNSKIVKLMVGSYKSDTKV